MGCIDMTYRQTHEVNKSSLEELLESGCSHEEAAFYLQKGIDTRDETINRMAAETYVELGKVRRELSTEYLKGVAVGVLGALLTFSALSIVF